MFNEITSWLEQYKESLCQEDVDAKKNIPTARSGNCSLDSVSNTISSKQSMCLFPNVHINIIILNSSSQRGIDQEAGHQCKSRGALPLLSALSRKNEASLGHWNCP